MNTNTFNPRFIFIVTAILIAASLRLFITIPNVTPIAAIALFGGAYLSRKYMAFIIPLVIMFLTDVIIGFHETMVAVYISFAITVGIGLLIRKRIGFMTALAGSLSSSILFYIITNFAVWSTGMIPYPLNFAGLMECYTAAIPFFRTEMIGTLCFNTLLFGSFYLASSKFPVLAKI